MTEVEDRNVLEQRLAASIGVALNTSASRALAAHGKAKYAVDREAARRGIIDALVTVLSNQFEIGQLDATSRLYITNYARPRDPFDNHPSLGSKG